MRRATTGVAGLVLFAVIAAVAGATGCFSERMSGPRTAATGECRIGLDSPVVGQVGAVIGLKDFAFQPRELRVPRGTRVTWVDCELPGVDFHTTTSDDGLWDSSAMTAGSMYSRVFNEPGRYEYHCIPHEQFMRGVVVVE
jgi:plastocyanin